jgi:galactoside O-acetyltransferase
MYMTNPMVDERYKNVMNMPVHIGKHVIIGATSVVLPGVELMEGSAFGSFSFINHNSESWSMNVGIPFKRIGDRQREVLRFEKEMMKETD